MSSDLRDGTIVVTRDRFPRSVERVQAVLELGPFGWGSVVREVAGQEHQVRLARHPVDLRHRGGEPFTASGSRSPDVDVGKLRYDERHVPVSHQGCQLWTASPRTPGLCSALTAEVLGTVEPTGRSLRRDPP